MTLAKSGNCLYFFVVFLSVHCPISLSFFHSFPSLPSPPYSHPDRTAVLHTEPHVLPLDLEDLESLEGKAKQAIDAFGKVRNRLPLSLSPSLSLSLSLPLAHPFTLFYSSLMFLSFLSLSLSQKVDVVIHNGGVSMRGAVEDTAFEVDERVMKINYFGAVRLTKAILPHFLWKRSGTFAVVSSMQGKIGMSCGWHSLSLCVSCVFHSLSRCLSLPLCFTQLTQLLRHHSQRNPLSSCLCSLQTRVAGIL